MKAAYIMMGLPGSGKSTYIEKNIRLFTNLSFKAKIISADEIKKRLKTYDPKNPQNVHEQSVKLAYEEVKSYCENNVDFIVDSGSINNSYTERMIKMIKNFGYKVHLIYIKTPLNVCLERNQLRKRKVPELDIKNKAVYEYRKFNELSLLVDYVEVVNYYKRKHIFFDMDGVLAGMSRLTRIDGEIDFLNSHVHKYLPPVEAVIAKANDLKILGKELYILSAIPNNLCYDHKNEWLNKHVPFIPQENRYYVNAGRNKALMLDNIIKSLKLDKQEVVLVEDTLSTIDECYNRGIEAVHVSEFLTQNF